MSEVKGRKVKSLERFGSVSSSQECRIERQYRLGDRNNSHKRRTVIAAMNFLSLAFRHTEEGLVSVYDDALHSSFGAVHWKGHSL
jgi:hypothetical protein